MIRSAPGAQGAPAESRRAPPPAKGSMFVGFTGQSYDQATRTVDAVFSVGARVKRWGYYEELEISATAVDLTRVLQGQCRFLDAHNQWEMKAVLGVVENARIETGALAGRIRLADTDSGRQAEGMISRGELTGISVGYFVRKWQLVEILDDDVHVWRAVDWELLEVSLVAVPADPSAGVRSAVPSPGSPSPAQTGDQNEDPDMRRNLLTGVALGAMAAMAPETGTGGAPAPESRAADPAPAAPAAPPAAPETRAAPSAPAAAAAQSVTRFTAGDAVAFVEQARSFGEAVATRATELVGQNDRGEISVETARSVLLQAAAETQRASTSGVAAGSAGRAGPGEREQSRDALVEALVARVTRAAPTDRAREFMGMRMLEIARERAGLNPRERDATVILRAAHTSSDFPLILEAAANKILLAKYATAMPTYQAIARRRDLSDFKATKLLSIGDFPTLQAYQEDGEIKSGTVNEGRESVTLGSYGRILRLSRQAIVNDDLNAFDDVFGSIGRVISRFENTLFYAMKAQGSGLGPTLADGHTVFKSNHANLAGSGAAPDITTLGAGRAAMRKQTDIDGNKLNLAPKIALVGPDTETVMEQLVASIQPVVSGAVNPFAGKLQVVSEASITGNAWELYADPQEAPVFSYGYLADAPGPRVLTEEPFNVDGIAFRATLDFYVGATDYRGAYRNPGA